MTRSENNVSSSVRLRAGELGHWLMRNNSGAFQDDTGRLIRFGLGNESKRLNDRIKSSDLIGIVPVKIEPSMVGKIIGVFTAAETKPENWKLLPSDKRGHAQQAFIEAIRERGGMATFCSSASQYDEEQVRWFFNMRKSWSEP